MMALRGRTLNSLDNLKKWVSYADWACIIFMIGSVAFACGVVFVK
jgi:hypothetical protein